MENGSAQLLAYRDENEEGEMNTKTKELKTVNAPADTVLQMIERAAINPDVDIDKMERLMVMKERMDNKYAEMLFNKAMSEAQSEMRQVAVDATNPQTRSFYASYAALDKALRPIYTKHGFSMSFDTGDCPAENWVRIICIVSHGGGFSRSPHIDLPADGKGAKGGDVMTKTHATGAAMSYGMRYLLKLVFNVAVGEDDIDGNEPEEHITEDQFNKLNALADEVGADKEGFVKYLKVESLRELPAKKFKGAMTALESKRDQRKKQ